MPREIEALVSKEFILEKILFQNTKKSFASLLTIHGCLAKSWVAALDSRCADVIVGGWRGCESHQKLCFEFFGILEDRGIIIIIICHVVACKSEVQKRCGG